MNQEEAGMKKFVYDCYDTLNNDRITHKSLFRFMKHVSLRQPGLNKNPTKLLALNETDHDMFLDIF